MVGGLTKYSILELVFKRVVIIPHSQIVFYIFSNRKMGCFLISFVSDYEGDTCSFQKIKNIDKYKKNTHNQKTNIVNYFVNLLCPFNLSACLSVYLKHIKICNVCSVSFLSCIVKYGPACLQLCSIGCMV